MVGVLSISEADKGSKSLVYSSIGDGLFVSEADKGSNSSSVVEIVIGVAVYSVVKRRLVRQRRFWKMSRENHLHRAASIISSPFSSCSHHPYWLFHLWLQEAAVVQAEPEAASLQSSWLEGYMSHFYRDGGFCSKYFEIRTCFSISWVGGRNQVAGL